MSTATRLDQARPAVRPALKARLMISGPTGAGKTYTSLRIAEVLAPGEPVLMIDTERESSLTYADHFTFTHLPWLPPFDPRELARTITAAGREYGTVIIDSASHFWRGAGGTLDIASGKFTGWKDARPAHEDMVQAILGCHAHVILCARSKMEHVQEEVNGRHQVRKLGMAPQQDDDLEYEMNISVEMDIDHRATVSKSRCVDVPVGRMFTAGHEVELAGIYAKWLQGGEPPAAMVDVDALVARMNALTPDRRVECKQRFVERFGRPEHLRASRVADAEALVAEFESKPPDDGGDGVAEASPGAEGPSGAGKRSATKPAATDEAAAAPPSDPASGEGSPHESDGEGSTSLATPTPAGSLTSGGGEQPSSPTSGAAPSPGDPEPGGGDAADDAHAPVERPADTQAPSGPAPTLEDLCELVAQAHPDRDTLTKQRNTIGRIAKEWCEPRGVTVPESAEALVGDPEMVAVVAAQLARDADPKVKALRTDVARMSIDVWGDDADVMRHRLVSAVTDGACLRASECDADRLADVAGEMAVVARGEAELYQRAGGVWTVGRRPA